MRFLVTADLHINQSIRSTYDPQAGMPTTWVEAFARLHEMIDIANERDVDYIIIGGDLWDDGHPTPENVALAKDAFARAKMPVIILGGNHDLKGLPGNHRTPAEVFLSDQPWCQGVYTDTGIIDLGGFEIAAVPWWRVQGTDSLSADSADLEVAVADMADRISKPSLLVGHLTVSEADFRQKDVRSAENLIRDSVLEALVPADVLDDGPWSAALLGHIHRAQSFTDKVRYVGSSYPITFGETAFHDGLKTVEIIDIDQSGHSVSERVPLDHRHLDVIDLSEDVSPRAVHTAIDADLAPIGREYRSGDMLRVVLDHGQELGVDERAVLSDLESQGVRTFVTHKPSVRENPSALPALRNREVPSPSDIMVMSVDDTLDSYLDAALESDKKAKKRIMGLFADIAQEG